MTVCDRYAGYTELHFDVPNPRILRITLGDPKSSPNKLNTVTSKMHRELVDIWCDVDKDDDISAVLLRGAGRGFSAGGDFTAVSDGMNDFHARMALWKETRDLVYNIVNCSKPIVSAMHGASVGAGLVCGLFADISIAAKDARLIDGHTRLGIAAGDQAAITWPIMCGMAKAKYYLLLCETLSGEEAERIGLVSLSVDAATLEETSLNIAERLANGAPSATRLTKHALNGWFRTMMPIFDASCAFEFLTLNSPDVAEGLASHQQKRQPAFDPKSRV